AVPQGRRQRCAPCPHLRRGRTGAGPGGRQGAARWRGRLSGPASAGRAGNLGVQPPTIADLNGLNAMARQLDLEEQEQLEELKHFWSKWGNAITWFLIAVLGTYAGWNGWQFWQR